MISASINDVAFMLFRRSIVGSMQMTASRLICSLWKSALSRTSIRSSLAPVGNPIRSLGKRELLTDLPLMSGAGDELPFKRGEA